MCTTPGTPGGAGGWLRSTPVHRYMYILVYTCTYIKYMYMYMYIQPWSPICGIFLSPFSLSLPLPLPPHTPSPSPSSSPSLSLPLPLPLPLSLASPVPQCPPLFATSVMCTENRAGQTRPTSWTDSLKRRLASIGIGGTIVTVCVCVCSRWTSHTRREWFSSSLSPNQVPRALPPSLGLTRARRYIYTYTHSLVPMQVLTVFTYGSLGTRLIHMYRIARNVRW